MKLHLLKPIDSTIGIQEEEKQSHESHDGARKRDSKRSAKFQCRESTPEYKLEKQRELRDKVYFENYGKQDIHDEMCKDEVRINHYREAIKFLCPNKVVVDVGAGTGLLTFYAVDNKAKTVFAIEQAVIASKIKKEIAKREIPDSVKLLNCLAEQAPLEEVAADVIVSEWMGYFLLFERMLPSVLAVRDKCLLPGGVMIPSTAKILLAAASIPGVARIPIIGAQSGVVSLHPLIQEVPGDEIKSNEVIILSLDLYSAPSDFDSFSSSFELIISPASKINALVGWFDVQMNGDAWMSTSPFKRQTHWHQTVFPLRDEISLEQGEKITGHIDCTPMLSDHRGLRITVDLTTQESSMIGPFEYMIY